MLDYFLKLKKKIGHRGSGNFSSLMHGAGIDLAENRQYTPGDEKRSINRKMSAKYDKLFVNLFHDEKALDIHLCCDINYNRKGDNTKLFLQFFVELTSYFGSRKAHITGRINDGQSFLGLEKLPYQKFFLDAFTEKTGSLFPRYKSSLHELLAEQAKLPKRRLIIVVSDFLEYGDEEKRLMNVLREKNEVLLFSMPTNARLMEAEIISLEVM